MENFLEFVQTNVHLAPWAIFGLLLLAGFNIPVSEDGMLFISALLASQHPDQMVPLFIGVFAGAYFSDLICFSLGRFLGPKLFKIRMFKNMVKPEMIDRLHGFYEKYGVVTLILGRFIPFGVRNGLFLTAGLGGMNPIKFSLSDLLACTISSVTFFTIYYNFGQTAIEYVKKGNAVIFGLAAVVVIVIVVLKKRAKKNTQTTLA